MTRSKLLVIGGVTASGKTAAAIELARRFGGELVGADSVQVYRGFDIGSAKPTREELGEIPHHLIDVIDPDEAIDAAGYAAMADDAIAAIHARGRVPIVVGGTGLWLRALLRGLAPLPAPDPEVRRALEEEADRIGERALHARLAASDPSTAARLHPNDRLRIVRALEVLAQTGRPLGELHAEHQKGAPRYDALVLALDRPRAELYAAIRARIQAMLAAGWVDEVRALLERWGPDVRAMGSVGYRQVKAHVLEGVPIEETERLAYKATCVYTRRQRTWMRGEEARWSTHAEITSPETIAEIARWSGGVV
jgi:tRNA dimethylallyltransferase